MAEPTKHVVIVGGGFAGLGAARRLASRDDLTVTLVDKHNYHMFQPLLYQVATCQLASADVAFSLRKLFRKHDNVHVKMGEVASVDPEAKRVTLESGQTIDGDYLMLAAGSRPNFFGTPGAEHAFPLYSLDDAQRLRSRILALFEEADKDASLVDRGALNFVIVGAGATGTEVAGALAEMIKEVMPREYQDLAVQQAKVTMVDLGHSVLAPFSHKAHAYAAKILQRDGVELRLGISVKEIASDHVVLSDGSTILTHCVVWGGGIMAGELAGSTGLSQGRGGRLDVEPDLTVTGHPDVYVLGDIANIPAPDGSSFPQLGSVALQSGQWAAKNIEAELDGKHRRAFHYHDKGIMAMIGRNAAIAEMGAHHHELHGSIAFASWLGVHAYLMTGVRTRIDAFIQWGWDYFSKTRGPQVLDRSDAARIDWGDDEPDDDEAPDDDADEGESSADEPPAAGDS